MKRRAPSTTTGALDRRTLFRYGAAGGVLAVVRPSIGGAAPAFPAEAAKPDPFELEEATISDLQRKMISGQESAKSLTEKYLARIEALDRKGPALRSVLETNPDALAIAENLDRERKAGRIRGHLHGIPVLIKDNIGTADRMTTTAGSLALEGSIPPADAFIVKMLREAGAVLLGKTNLSEWANFRSTHSSSGWSGRGGQCRNPYALDRTPSGSSSGSAAAVASSFCAAAIGSETNGSIVSPSATCSLVGIKPTVGLVSRSVIIPISRTQDTAGPIARTVTDAAILLGVIAGADPHDRATMARDAKREASYAAGLDANALHGMRIGVPREQYFGYSTSADSITQHAIDLMREKGAVIVDPVPIEKLGAVGEAEFEVLLYEFKAGINDYLASLGAGSKMRTLADLITFND